MRAPRTIKSLLPVILARSNQDNIIMLDKVILDGADSRIQEARLLPAATQGAGTEAGRSEREEGVGGGLGKKGTQINQSISGSTLTRKAEQPNRCAPQQQSPSGRFRNRSHSHVIDIHRIGSWTGASNAEPC